MHNQNEPPINRADFKLYEVRGFAAILGICGVCLLSAVLGQWYQMFWLFLVRAIVREIKEDKPGGPTFNSRDYDRYGDRYPEL